MGSFILTGRRQLSDEWSCFHNRLIIMCKLNQIEVDVPIIIDITNGTRPWLIE